MGVPLAALAINQQQPGPLDMASKALQLKALAQQQQYQAQAQPLELQQRQQALQSETLKNKMQEQQLKDSDLFMKSLSKNNGNWDTALEDSARNGMSGEGYMQFGQMVLAHKQAATKLSTEQLANKKASMDIVDGELQGFRKLAPEDQAAQWPQIRQRIAQADPEFSGISEKPPTSQQLDQLDAVMLGGKQTADREMKAREVAAQEMAAQARMTTAQKPQQPTEAGLAAQATSGGPNAPAAEAALKRLDQSKIASRPIIGAIPGPALSDTAKDQAAEKYWQTGQLPQGNRGAAGMIQNRGIMNRAAELHPTGNLAANSAEYKANSASLSKVQTQSDTVEAFENTALKNLDQVLKAAEAIPDVGVKFLNTPIRAFDSKVVGTENMARLNAALLTGRTESARVLNSANATGVLTNEARGEVEQILSGNMTYPAMKAAINQLKVDMGNRKQSYRDQISDIKGRLGGGSAAPAAAPAPGGYQPLPSFKEWDAQRKAQAKP